MSPLARAVEQAADQLRTANRTTVRSPITATDAYDVVGNLDDLARRLPQLLDVVTRSLKRADPGDYFDDRGIGAGQALCLAHVYLDEAQHYAAELAAHLTATHNQLGHLGRLVTED